MSNFKGLYTALVTPFKQEKIDYQALELLLDNQINAKVDGIVIAGSTGEIPTLLDNEYKELLSYSIEYVNGRTKVIAGIGYNSTAKTIEAAKLAESLNADAVLGVTPYYNKPTQEGLFRHYSAIHKNCGLPIILYSVPSRTGVDISDELLVRLSKLPKIVAYKDASGDIERPLRIRSMLGERFNLLCGDDSVALAYNVNGGVGCISAASNIVPKQLKKIQDLTLDGQFKEALNLHVKFMELFEVLFIETNPIALKYALSLQDLCSDELRLPLCELSENNKKIVKTTMEKLGLI